MAKLANRIGAAVALVAGASTLATGTALAADTAPQHHHTGPAHTAPDVDHTSEDTTEDGNMANLGKCYDLGATKDAFFALHGLDINYKVPLLLDIAEGKDGISLDPLCAGLTYGPFSAHGDQPTLPTASPAPTPPPVHHETPDTDTDTDAPDDPSFPISGGAGMPDPFGSGAGLPDPFGALLGGNSPDQISPASPLDTGSTAQQNPLGSLIPSAPQGDAGQGIGTSQAGGNLLPGLL